MSTNKISRALMPLLAAPVALIALAANATAIDVPPYTYDSDDRATRAECDHPSYEGESNPATSAVEGLGFYVDIATGGEDTPEGYDISRMVMYAVDDAPGAEWREPNANVLLATYSYGVFSGKDTFVPTSPALRFRGISSTGTATTTAGASEVQGVKFHVVWRLSHPRVTRSLTCTVALDKYNDWLYD